MPIVQISLVEGRDDAAVKACIKALARTIHETLGAPLETIRVFATIVPPSHWAVGDQTRDESVPAASQQEAG
jgi:4-oxalocrotonate tautomerase